MQTGDGIQRVSEADALLAPDGGEGGSVLRALGSKEAKAVARAKRREEKKENYAKYLESSTWRKIRARALKRDKNKCRACGEKAEHVHHIRYPKKLGDEKMEWLYSLCAECHNAIHRAAQKMTLREATDLILGGGSREGNITYLPYVAPKRGNRGHWKKKPSRTAKKKKKAKPLKKIEPFEVRTGGPLLNAHGLPKQSRKAKKRNLVAANDDLHAFFKANRERRERRFGA